MDEDMNFDDDDESIFDTEKIFDFIQTLEGKLTKYEYGYLCTAFQSLVKSRNSLYKAYFNSVQAIYRRLEEIEREKELSFWDRLKRLFTG